MSAGRKSRAVAGFTLVEILVVMAIISILAGLLLPVLAKSLEAARVVACGNSVRQWIASVHQFADDYSGYLPCGQFKGKDSGSQHELFPDPVHMTGSHCTWIDRGPSNLWWFYYKPLYEARAWCPSHPGYNPAYGFEAPEYKYILAERWVSEASMNPTLRIRKMRMSHIRRPSTLFLFAERAGYLHGSTGFCNHYYNGYESLKGLGYYCLGWHHDNYTSFNAGFFDGHVSKYIGPPWQPRSQSDSDWGLEKSNFENE